MKKLLLLHILCFIIINNINAFADLPKFGFNSSRPWTNRLQTNGISSLKNTQLDGSLDNMLPVLGSDTTNLFLDGGYDAATGFNSITSIGAGGRFLRNWTSSKQVIFGTYAFALYQDTPTSNVWYINPGVELFTNYQLLRFQLYFPITAKLISYGYFEEMETKHRREYIVPGEHLDEYGNGIEFLFDQTFNYLYGGDFVIDLYHFSFPISPDINGAAFIFELDFPDNKFTTDGSFFLQQNYDNQQNYSIMIGLSFTFGGPDDRPEVLSSRMEEPIDRFLARRQYALVGPNYTNLITTGSPVLIPPTPG
ncbi:MAG: hypothetical protein A3F18_02200 [Legionellales bacterium RIFCSPHIGHO2_12_FULL_37_14]|nr:MAG: hypothetical protein A3F18_02200 [Legionellales bacterium RIFCSPHIGHO2_12_FULL_37_14]